MSSAESFFRRRDSLTAEINKPPLCRQKHSLRCKQHLRLNGAGKQKTGQRSDTQKYNKSRNVLKDGPTYLIFFLPFPDAKNSPANKGA